MARHHHASNLKSINFQGEVTLIAAGIAVSLVGLFSIYATLSSSVISVLFIGFFFLFASVFQWVFSFVTSKLSASALHIGQAILYGIAGLYLILNPRMGEITLTLILSFLFIASGLSRIITSQFVRKIDNRGWTFVTGLISAALGVYVYTHLAEVSMYLLGWLVGIDLVVLGIYLISVGIYVRISK